jgi:hypothetical protein
MTKTIRKRKRQVPFSKKSPEINVNYSIVTIYQLEFKCQKERKEKTLYLKLKISNLIY